MKIDIFTEGNISLPYLDITEKRIKKTVAAICKKLKLKSAVITIILCDNKYIKKINKDYRKKNEPTDVISFSYREIPFPAVKSGLEELGDIYISLEKASENAEKYEAAFADEITRLLIHGVLHLLGYDHERSDEDEKIMRAKEEEILANF
ncbi:MAG: rRNA maturation RNase YbeY [Spirochaetota bacterium]